jgi:predicted GNAT family acetyltransferase
VVAKWPFFRIRMPILCGFQDLKCQSRENGLDVDYIMTEKELAKSFCKIYCSLSGKKYYNNLNMVLYLLEKVNELSLPNGSFRKADESDMYYLPYWYADFIPACNLGDYDLAEGIRNAKQAINDGIGYVWVDGVPVSYAASTRHTSSCVFIGNVYTPPNLRGKGYSTACVASLSKKLLDDGWRYCGLYADCANPYSNKVYQNVGYREVFYYNQYKLNKEA